MIPWDWYLLYRTSKFNKAFLQYRHSVVKNRRMSFLFPVESNTTGSRFNEASCREGSISPIGNGSIPTEE